MAITHKIQLLILKQLLYYPRLRFRDLNSLKIDNNHFNFHLKRLINLKIIKKENIYYSLSSKGLSIANRLDTKKTGFTVQPKVGVLVIPFRKNLNRYEVLVGKRLKDVKKGEYTFFTEKISRNDTLLETASRCLKNETGLEADYKFAGVIHHFHYKDNLLIEVVLLNCFKAENIKGKLKLKSKESENKWISYTQAVKISGIYQETFKLLCKVKTNQIFFREIRVKE